MRWLLALWGLPLALFWSWYFLSYYDYNFGYIMLSRQVHDLVFELYGEALGIDPKLLPGMIAKALVLDSFILAGIIAFRRRRAIQDWFRARRRLASHMRPSLNA
jgi:hypothetical protein